VQQELNPNLPAYPDFVAGKLSTSFMERLLSRPAPGRLAEAV